ncbi:MAG: DUF5606 family protein [Flavobacteriales bacterium]|tara:strand:+ start:177 stop:710 length:534 start_codon:yes stop_codon:yes gene_type:complete
MKISDVLAISGKPGLFKILASSSKNLVVESMLDGKRSSIPGSLRVSSLSDITMYTINEDVPLREIIKSMYDKNKGKAAISHNASPQEVKDFVDSVVDDLDHDRVYASDLRKLVQWYNLLISQKALPFEEEEEKEDGKSDDKKAPSKKKPTAKNKQASSKKPLAKKAPTKKSTKTTKK